DLFQVVDVTCHSEIWRLMRARQEHKRITLSELYIPAIRRYLMMSEQFFRRLLTRVVTRSLFVPIFGDGGLFLFPSHSLTPWTSMRSRFTIQYHIFKSDDLFQIVDVACHSEI